MIAVANASFLPLLDESIDLTVTSPPYGNLRTYRGFTFDFKSIAGELYRVTKQGGVVVWVVGDETKDGSESGESFRQALYFKSIGFNLHDTMIYEKDAFRFPRPKAYHNIFEYMFVLSKGTPKTVNLIKDRKNLYNESNAKKRHHFKRERDGNFSSREAFLPTEYGTRYNIWRYGAGGSKGTLDRFSTSHPAQFPELLARDHILSWSNEGDTVLDPMCGSGTTCKMAVETGRRYVGFDISPEYAGLAQRRVDGARIPMMP